MPQCGGAMEERTMDVILTTKTEQTGRDCFLIDIVICDRDYNILFNGRFTKGFWVTPPKRKGPTIPDRIWKPSPDFGERAKEVTSLLLHNRVIIFGDWKFELHDMITDLQNLYYRNDKYSILDTRTVKFESCRKKAFDFYVPRLARIDIDEFSLHDALKLSYQENVNLNVHEPADKGPINTARHACLSTAFVYNVIEESTKRKAA